MPHFEMMNIGDEVVQRPGLSQYLFVRDRLEVFYRQHFVYQLEELDAETYESIRRGRLLDHYMKFISYGHSPWEKELGRPSTVQLCGVFIIWFIGALSITFVFLFMFTMIGRCN